MIININTVSYNREFLFRDFQGLSIGGWLHLKNVVRPGNPQLSAPSPLLSGLHSVFMFTPYLFAIDFNIIVYIRMRCKSSLPLKLSGKNLVGLWICQCLMHATCLADSKRPEFIIVTTFYGQYELWRNSLCSLCSVMLSCLWKPSVLLGPLFLNIIYVLYCVRARNQFLDQNKRTYKITLPYVFTMNIFSCRTGKR